MRAFFVLVALAIVAVAWAAPREKRQRTVIEKTTIINGGRGGNYGPGGGFGGNRGGFGGPGYGPQAGFGRGPAYGGHGGFGGGPGGFGRGPTTVIKETVIRG